jgi:hypothetical protein
MILNTTAGKSAHRQHAYSPSEKSPCGSSSATRRRRLCWHRPESKSPRAIWSIKVTSRKSSTVVAACRY